MSATDIRPVWFPQCCSTSTIYGLNDPSPSTDNEGFQIPRRQPWRLVEFCASGMATEPEANDTVLAQVLEEGDWVRGIMRSSTTRRRRVSEDCFGH